MGYAPSLIQSVPFGEPTFRASPFVMELKAKGRHMSHHRKQYVAAPTAATPITVLPSTSMNVTASGVDNHTLKHEVRASTTAGNTLSVDPLGVYVPASAGTPLTAVSTNSVTLATSGVNGHTLTANVKVDLAAGAQNKLVVSAAGVRVAPARKTRIVTATGTVTAADTVVIVNNGAANITLTFSGAFDPDQEMSFTRAPGSTGSVTLTGTGFTFQALSGAVRATTSLSLHTAAGGGVLNAFVLNSTTWYRAA